RQRHQIARGRQSVAAQALREIPVRRVTADGVQLALLEEREAIAFGVRRLTSTVDEGDLGLRIDAEMAQRDPGVHIGAALAVAAEALATQLPGVLDPRLRDEH